MSIEDYLSRPHDLFTRQNLGRLEVARDIVIHFLPAPLVQELNLDTMTLLSESFVDSELRASQSDVLYHVEFRDGRSGQIYILFEHKSYCDPMAVFQLLRYMVRIWERQQRQQEQLTPVIPVVLYHGADSWSAARSLRELVGGPKILQHYIPDFAVELLDLSKVSDDELPRQSLTRATLLLLKYIFRAELRAHLEEIFRSAALQRGDEELQDILRSFLTYVAAAARQIEMRDLGPVVAKSLDTKGEHAMTSILEEWIEKGRVEGLEEGRVQAMRSGISDILTVRFPDDAAALGARINCLDSAELLRDVHRLSLTAVSATEISDWLASHG